MVLRPVPEAASAWKRSVSTARVAAAVLALVVALTIAARLGLTMSNWGRSFGEALWGSLRFFTIWTNILIGFAMLWIAFGRRLSAAVLSCLTMSIGMVSLIYYALLFRLTNMRGADAVVDVMLHAVIPLGLLAYWLALVDKSRLRFRDTLLWQLYPLTYCVYALIRGTIEGFYPYPFLRPTQIGWPAVLVNIALLAAVFVTAGLAVVALGRWLDRRRATR